MGDVGVHSFLSLPISEHRKEDSGARRKTAKTMLYLAQQKFLECWYLLLGAVIVLYYMEAEACTLYFHCKFFSLRMSGAIL